MLNKFTKLSIRFPKIIIFIFVGISILFALQIPDAKIDTAIKSQIPEDMPSRLNIEKIQDLFGGTEIIMLSLKTDDVLDKDTLKRVKKLSAKLAEIKEIEEVRSPFTLQDIKGEKNQLIIEDAVKQIPETKEEEKKLRIKIKNNDLLYGNLIAKDFKAVALVGILQEEYGDEEVLNKVKKIIKQIPGEEETYLAGLPPIRVKASQNIKDDMRKFMPLGLVIMLIFLYFCFRQLRGVLLPFVVVVMSIVIAMGLLVVLDWKIQLITVILPVILIAITNDYAIHIIARYQQEDRMNPKLAPEKIVHSVVSDLSYPILAAGLTTIVGLLCLLAHIIVPARQLGVLAAVGNGVALLASLLFVPAVLTLLPQEKVGTGKIDDLHLLEKWLSFLIKLIAKQPKRIIIVSCLIVVLISSGIIFLKVDTNVINYFNPRAEVVKANQVVNNYFGGATNISVVAKGDIMSPEVMKEINALEKKLKQHENVGDVTAISRLMREMNQVLHNDQEEYNRIPDSRNAIAQYFMLYTMSDEVDKLVDFNREHALITARINTSSTNKITGVVEYIRKYINHRKDSPFVLLGGFAHLLSELAQFVVKGQLASLFLSLGIVALIVIFLFRSIKAGIMAIIPLSLAMINLFGLMGYFNIELNMVTALLSSIMIGVGIDYTIHFLWDYRKHKQDKTAVKAVEATLLTAGRAIIFNAFSVMVGFIVLLVSNFLPVRFFGFLVVVSITGCLFGALVILPAICIIFEPDFLEYNN